MAESIWGGTAAPHPTAKPTWTMVLTAAGGEAGTFTLTVAVGRWSATTAAIAVNATAAAVAAAINLLGVPGGNVAGSGGPLGTGTVTLKFNAGPVKLTRTTSFTAASSLVLASTDAGIVQVPNQTFGPKVSRVDGTVRRPRYTPDYLGKQTPAETYVDPSGNNMPAPKGGVTASKPNA